MAGKPNQSGFKTSLDPHREGFTDIGAKLLHGHSEWKMIRLRELISEEEKQFDPPWLADNHLSTRTAAKKEIARRKRYVELDEIDALWRDTVAGFERAVLDGNADWFARQAKAIRSGDSRSDTDKALDRFEAAVARELAMAFWRTRAEQQKRNGARREVSASDTHRHAERNKVKDGTQQAGKQRTAAKRWLADQQKLKTLDIEDATLEPAGKQTGITARQVLDRLNVETVTRPSEIHGKGGALLKPSKRTYVLVEGCRFASKRRACGAITRIAELHGWDLLV